LNIELHEKDFVISNGIHIITYNLQRTTNNRKLSLVNRLQGMRVAIGGVDGSLPHAVARRDGVSIYKVSSEFVVSY